MTKDYTWKSEQSVAEDMPIYQCKFLEKITYPSFDSLLSVRINSTDEFLSPLQTIIWYIRREEHTEATACLVWKGLSV